MAGAVGLRDVRYGYDGANHVFAKAKDGAANDACRDSMSVSAVNPRSARSKRRVSGAHVFHASQTSTNESAVSESS